MAFQYPQTHYTQRPFAPIPLPRPSAQPPTLDPILQHLQSGPVITWSVSEHPSTASTNMALPYGEVWQNRAATYPYTSSLTIWSGPTKDRPIVIDRDPCVTIGDVLVHVYYAVRVAAREHYQPPPQPLLLHPYALPQPVPGTDEQQLVLCYLNGHNTWKGLAFHDMDSWWLDVRR